MSTVDRYRPPREGYQPPSLPPKPPVAERVSKSPSRQAGIPPAVPSPPTHTSRTSPPRPQSRRSAPSPAQSSPLRSKPLGANQWFFTADEVASTPSIIDGLTRAEERLRRAKGVNFIYQAGILLDLPQITLWVAAVFFHRFYMRFSMVEEKSGIHHYNIAATSLFLANKTEENCRKTKDLIIAVAKVAQKNAKLIIDEQSKEYWRWRDSILTYEELMLETLTFDLMVETPYQRLFDQVRHLNLTHNKRIREAAWTFCNDAGLTILPLIMGARHLAISAIFFATAVTQEKIDDVDGEAWWKSLGADEDLTIKAVETMNTFYAENPLRKQTAAGYPGSPVFSLENTRRRGEALLGHTEAGSSQNGTPMYPDHDTQSPAARLNGRTHHDNDVPDRDISKGETGSDAANAETERETVKDDRGDSDSTLKAAANDLSVHEGRPNFSDIRSPGVKRSTLELGEESEGERRSKRRRTEEADEDEGEIR